MSCILKGTLTTGGVAKFLKMIYISKKKHVNFNLYSLYLHFAGMVWGNWNIEDVDKPEWITLFRCSKSVGWFSYINCSVKVSNQESNQKMVWFMIRWTSNSWSFLLYYLSTRSGFWSIALPFLCRFNLQALKFLELFSIPREVLPTQTLDHPSLRHMDQQEQRVKPSTPPKKKTC